MTETHTDPVVDTRDSASDPASDPASDMVNDPVTEMGDPTGGDAPKGPPGEASADAPAEHHEERTASSPESSAGSSDVEPSEGADERRTESGAEAAGESGDDASHTDEYTTGKSPGGESPRAEHMVEDPELRPAIEAILLVADEPISDLTLASVLGRPQQVVAQTLRELSRSYTEENRGFDLRQVAGGWRYYTRPEYAEAVERFVLDGQQARLTQAALETLAVVAYRQPVSRARVSAIRGVNCDGVMRTLLSRGLIEEAGTDSESQATLYRTTSYFLERLGLQSLDDLPDLAPYLPDVDQIDAEASAEAARPTEPREQPDEYDEQRVDQLELPPEDHEKSTAENQPGENQPGENQPGGTQREDEATRNPVPPTDDDP